MITILFNFFVALQHYMAPKVAPVLTSMMLWLSKNSHKNFPFYDTSNLEANRKFLSVKVIDMRHLLMMIYPCLDLHQTSCDMPATEGMALSSYKSWFTNAYHLGLPKMSQLAWYPTLYPFEYHGEINTFNWKGWNVLHDWHLRYGMTKDVLLFLEWWWYYLEQKIFGYWLAAKRC